MSTTFNYTTGSAPAHPMAQGSRSHFSPRRFWHVLRHDLMENPRYDLRVLIGITLGCLFVMYVVFNGSMTSSMLELQSADAGLPEEFKQLVLKDMGESLEGYYLFILTLLVSYSFMNLRTKQGRIAYFMLPATNLEKFVSRIVKYFVVGGIAILGCVVLSDGLRWLIMCIVHGDGYGFVTPYFLGNMVNMSLNITVNVLREGSMRVIGFYSLWVSCVYFFTLYLLGGMVFRKQPFILTSLVIVVALVVLGFMSVRMLPLFTCRSLPAWLFDQFHNIYALLVTLLVVFNVWLTYRLFKRASVVPGQGILH